MALFNDKLSIPLLFLMIRNMCPKHLMIRPIFSFKKMIFVLMSSD